MLNSPTITVDEAARAAAYQRFCNNYPEWHQTALLDTLRATEYRRLDEQGHVYLDYTGGGLYSDSQICDHLNFLRGNVLGNPHSHNPTSLAMTERVEATRAAILDFFNASPQEYTVIFTANASAALKLVGESYPFRAGATFALTADNHNSVNGIREFARMRGARTRYLPVQPDELRLDETEVESVLSAADPSTDNLFAYPAQSNFTGVKHPLALVTMAQRHGWDVLLDCAAFATTTRLDLSAISPEFVTLSFYKMFGYPTGCGCLIAKRSALHKLQRPWFAGGTIQIASVTADGHYFVDGEAAFEDGTVNYLMLPAVESGLNHLNQIGMQMINRRVRCLTGWLLDQLVPMCHSNGHTMIKIHGPQTTELRGGTITMNINDPDGEPLSGALLEQLAAEARISLRTGCFCNPGAGEIAHQVDQDLLRRAFARAEGIGFSELVALVRAETGTEISAIRISVGLATNFNDVYYFMQFVERLRDTAANSLGVAQAQRHIRDAA